MVIFIFMYFIIPLFVGILGGAIAAWITGQVAPDPNTKKRTVIVIFTGIILAILTIIVLFLITPQYRLSGFSWCQTQDKSVRIKGNLLNRFGEGVSGETLQIQIFPAREGVSESLENAVFATTSEDGQVFTEIQRSKDWSLAEGKYELNFVYWYQDPLTGNEKNQGINKRQGEPYNCVP